LKKILILSVIVFSITNLIRAADEKYYYSVSYLGIPVTSVKVEINKDEALQNITAHATSKGIASAFFKVDNEYTTFCDSTYRPYLFKKSVTQQNLKDYKTINFRSGKNLINVKNSFTKSGEFEFQTKETIYDLISFSFAAAHKDSSKKSFSVISDFDVWNFELISMGDEYISTTGKKYICDKYRVKMTKIIDNAVAAPTDVLTNNLFGENNKLYIWYSADKTKIPVKMKFKKFLFNVVLMLQNTN